MLREIQRLQKRNETLEDEKDTLEEKNDWIERIVRALKEDAHGTEIIQRLKRGETHQAIAEWLGRPMIDGINNLSPTSGLKLAQELEDYHMDLIENRDPRFWTTVTTNAGLIEHLVGLYLTWIHPVHMLFDEGKFVTSFRGCTDIYCSSSLVNAICGMSCHLLHNSWDNDEDIRAAIEALSSRFMNEARALMKEADEDKMTVLQTYAVMFLFELGSGKGRVAGTYLRLATEILVAKQQAEQSRESEEVSTWGVFTLHTCVSLRYGTIMKLIEIEHGQAFVLRNPALLSLHMLPSFVMLIWTLKMFLGPSIASRKTSQSQAVLAMQSLLHQSMRSYFESCTRLSLFIVPQVRSLQPISFRIYTVDT